MSKWQDINTAPAGKRVKLGKWHISSSGNFWTTDSGIAFHRILWLFRMRTFYGGYYTHWQPLPPPPESE